MYRLTTILLSALIRRRELKHLNRGSFLHVTSEDNKNLIHPMMEGVPTTAGPNKVPLHPESIKLLEFRKKNGIKIWSEMEVLEAREFQTKTLVARNETYDFQGEISNLHVPSQHVPGGIPIRVYKPKSSRPNLAVMMFFHGGGQVLGSVASYDICCRMLADMCDVIVVSVEYRLAPEHKLPAGLEDCDTATKWVMTNKTKIGGTEDSVVGVAGDSAGGQSAAMACHYITGLTFQVLVYGRLDERSTYSSFTEFKNGPVMTWDVVMWYQKHRLPDQSASLTNPRFSAMLQTKFNHLPPTMFVVAECDPFRDDSFEYKKKLDAAGVYNRLHVAKGALHGFFGNQVFFKESCNEAYSKIADFIKKVVYKE